MGRLANAGSVFDSRANPNTCTEDGDQSGRMRSPATFPHLREPRKFRESVIGIFMKKKREIAEVNGERSIFNSNPVGDVLNKGALLIRGQVGPAVIEVFAFRSDFLT